MREPHQLVAWAAFSRSSLMRMMGEAERRGRFGYALQEALRARQMSERQLAQRLAVDPRRVARWRTGKGLPDLYETQALVSILRVSEDLFRDPPPVPEMPAYPIERYLLDAVDQGAEEGLLDEPLTDEDGDEPDEPPDEPQR
jgi:transcriptional regulator with XRE-family HTH domain